MFYFRINKIQIANNREGKSILGILGKDLAEVKFVSFVTTDATELPDASSYVAENDAAKKQELLSSMITNIVSSRILTSVENVKDNSTVTFGDTGYVLYKTDTVPQDFSWQLLAIESDKHARDTAQMVSGILKHKEFGTFTNNLGILLKSAANPAYVASVAIVKFAAQVICDAVKNDKDDMIGLVYMSLDKDEHYPDGVRSVQNVADLTSNMLFDYSIFAH